MPKRNLRLTIAYDGTDFHGWQIQAAGRTVQGVMESALERMHKEPVRVAAAGRTDSGVHADGQVVTFQTGLDSIPSDRFHIALNSWLPHDVQALDSCEVGDRFHARFSAASRTYRYYYSLSEVAHPRGRAFAVRLRHRPSIATLNRMCAPLIGSHDFTTFTLPREPSESKVRNVLSAAFFPLHGQLVFEIRANAFLWRMVRSIVGTIIELEKNGGDPARIEAALEARSRASAGPTAPSSGLVLHYVEYSDRHG